MSKYKKLAHVIYKCDYHIVQMPKYRLRILTGTIRDLVDSDIRMLCEWKNSEAVELIVQGDHIHLVVSVSRKVSISNLVEVLKGKNAIKLFYELPRFKEETLLGKSFLDERIFC